MQAVSHLVKDNSQSLRKKVVRVDVHVYAVRLLPAAPARERLELRSSLLIGNAPVVPPLRGC